MMVALPPREDCRCGECWCRTAVPVPFGTPRVSLAHQNLFYISSGGGGACAGVEYYHAATAEWCHAKDDSFFVPIPDHGVCMYCRQDGLVYRFRESPRRRMG